MDNLKSLKLVLPLVIAFLLVVFGVFQLFKKTVINQTSEATPIPISTPTSNFEVPPSPTPQVMGTTPLSQPAAGTDTVEIKNIGIYVDAPKTNQKVISPLQIEGFANVTNGIVQIRIKDSGGNILGTGDAKACLGTDACPFKTSFIFTKSKTPEGTLELYSLNSTTGAEDYLQIIPIKF
ncbi:hypothetical protein A2870_04425 [Candidatus Curtissbacteria bacterium RIFCSPHIGHO2_01_FULL_41_11]|uniref:Bacterial spore germination immunoglobulin-like domain-containing protein n=1 Tax=Candidatus Curtissbacteria bacterium RIFCSPHIGHO2_01_FULL_41_11 TaxID=1797711 RepID=A0A1F5G568_9BACT|nr:MAG: hypothetical protein A2870_04425 [Candidatus Curtissbacteria bacterium RIFCSPHIGHO2_01_FULL_41_11]